MRRKAEDETNLRGKASKRNAVNHHEESPKAERKASLFGAFDITL